jgi:hypothetical protein
MLRFHGLHAVRKLTEEKKEPEIDSELVELWTKAYPGIDLSVHLEQFIFLCV